MNIKLAIIGCGRIGHENSLFKNKLDYSYFGTVRQIKKTDIVAICDKNKKKLQNIHLKNKQLKKYTSYKNIFKENKVDIAIISTPDATHYDILKYLIKCNLKGIIIEKPALKNLKQIDFIIKNNTKKIPIQINYSRRFIKEYHSIKKNIKNNFYGKILSINFTFSGGIFHNGCHFFDLCTFLIGKINFENSFLKRKSSYIKNDYYGLYIFKKKNIKIIFNVLNEKSSIHEKIEIITKKNTLIINNNEEIIFFRKKKNSNYKNYYVNSFSHLKKIQTSKSIYNNFINLLFFIKNKKKLISPITNEILWHKIKEEI